MLPEFGLFFIILALLSALMQAAYLFPQAGMRAVILPCLPSAAWLQALCITLALVTLMTLRLDSDFSVINVVQHSNLTLPTLYKIVGTWGNHEGSMLLFVWVLAAFGAALAITQNSLAAAVQALLGVGLLFFILFTSNPFVRIFPPTVDGEALNPILQDIALAMHPPMLYLGYVGFSVVFSLAVAALIQGRMDRDWAARAHPWILASWSTLTLGIGLGSWWAYRELGWGGWWFWDPVENASLLPWLSGTALLHSNIVLKKRGLLKQWVLLLSIITFALSLLGTFLVRSGSLSSVHSFASDPARGLFIMGYIVLAVGGALLLFALRAGKLQPAGAMLPVSREGMIVVNNLFLLTACATVFLGTVYPMLAEALGDKLTVGPPYFNLTFLPLMAVPLLFTGLVPFMPWKSASLRRGIFAARPSLLAACAAILIMLAWAKTDAVLAALGFGLSIWLAASSVQWLVQKRGIRGAASVFLGHIGAAIMVAGITGSSLWKQETERWVLPGDALDIAGYHLTYKNEHAMEMPDYTDKRGEFAVADARGDEIAVLHPEYRLYAIRGTGVSIAAIHVTPLYDLYAVIGETSAQSGKTAARIYYKPMMGFIWLGFVIMALGGITAIIQQTRQHVRT